MKKIIYCLLITALLGVAVFAQTPKQTTRRLPAGISGWSGEDSDRLLNDPIIKMRLKTLLGKKNYTSFMETFETITPIEKDGNVLFASGCLIHACTHLESAIAIDLKNNTVHAAIFRDEKPTRFFNERGRKTPGPILAWAKRLSEIKAPEGGE